VTSVTKVGHYHNQKMNDECRPGSAPRLRRLHLWSHPPLCACACNFFCEPSTLPIIHYCPDPPPMSMFIPHSHSPYTSFIPVRHSSAVSAALQAYVDAECMHYNMQAAGRQRHNRIINSKSTTHAFTFPLDTLSLIAPLFPRTRTTNHLLKAKQRAKGRTDP